MYFTSGNIELGRLVIIEGFFIQMGYRISLKISSDSLHALSSAGKLFLALRAVYANRLSPYVTVFTDCIPRKLLVDDMRFRAGLYC